MPVERALGVQWNIDGDTFGFKMAAEEKPLTHHRLLSTLSSVYDLLGLAALFILEGCIIIKTRWKENSAWDEPIPRRSKDEWNIWKEKHRNLEKIKAAKCFEPRGFSNIKDASAHYFSDASGTGYGQTSYCR